MGLHQFFGWDGGAVEGWGKVGWSKRRGLWTRTITHSENVYSHSPNSGRVIREMLLFFLSLKEHLSTLLWGKKDVILFTWNLVPCYQSACRFDLKNSNKLWQRIKSTVTGELASKFLNPQQCTTKKMTHFLCFFFFFPFQKDPHLETSTQD